MENGYPSCKGLSILQGRVLKIIHVVSISVVCLGYREEIARRILKVVYSLGKMTLSLVMKYSINNLKT